MATTDTIVTFNASAFAVLLQSQIDYCDEQGADTDIGLLDRTYWTGARAAYRTILDQLTRSVEAPAGNVFVVAR